MPTYYVEDHPERQKAEAAPKREAKVVEAPKAETPKKSTAAETKG